MLAVACGVSRTPRELETVQREKDHVTSAERTESLRRIRYTTLQAMQILIPHRVNSNTRPSCPALESADKNVPVQENDTSKNGILLP